MFCAINDDHAARNWQDAVQLVAHGQAAMSIMGDWAKNILMPLSVTGFVVVGI